VSGQRIGYVRVSSFDQNPGRQLETVQLDRVFTDKASGKDTLRPQLEALCTFVREGDTVLVHSMDRLARNLDDLRRIVQTLTTRGVHIEFVTENLRFTGDDSPLAHLMLSVMGAFAEFERALIRERQRKASRSPDSAASIVAAPRRSPQARSPRSSDASPRARRKRRLPASSASVARHSTSTCGTGENPRGMSHDAHRLSILTTKEIDALYGLPRFTAQERQLYFDVSPAERAAVEAHTPAVAVHLTLQLGYFKAKRQFFLYDAEMVSEDIRYVCALYFPGTAFELLTPLSRPTRLAQQQTILTLFSYRRCDRAAREDLEHKAQRIALLSTQPSMSCARCCNTWPPNALSLHLTPCCRIW
jgi:DNA invertase Pin-like site-specific DNA recombinase